MKHILPGIIVGVFGVLVFLSLFHTIPSFAVVSDTVVISEIQVAGAVSGDDFIELYNPTSSQIDLSDFRLVKRTSTGDSDDNIVAFQEGDVIEAHGFFLWCNNNIAATLVCDSSTSATIANNNSVGLREGALTTGALIDAVTFGTIANPLGEGTPIAVVPEASQSVERKPGEASPSGGNGEDTDNNSADFVLRTVPEPQNSASTPETPADEVTPTGELSPTATNEPTPSDEPSPSPTVEPSPTPSEEPSPTSEPTMTPLPTLEPTPTVEPTLETIRRLAGIFPFSRKVCYLEFKPFTISGFRFLGFPRFVCTTV